MSTDQERRAAPKLFPGALEIMVLRSLKRRPMHGYALAKSIEEGSRGLLIVLEGSLYLALQRLLTAGHVECEWTISATSRRVRKYSITAAGSEHLGEELSRFRQILTGITLVLGRNRSDHRFGRGAGTSRNGVGARVPAAQRR